MIRRLYVHNFRGLDNFELPISALSSVLLIGRNGSGKTSVGLALEILQKIARGTNRVNSLITLKDLSYWYAALLYGSPAVSVPVRFEIEAELNGIVYGYVIAFDSVDYKGLRVLEEKFSVDGQPVYVRKEADVHLVRKDQEREKEADFRIDWHLVALPIIQEQSEKDPLFIFKHWLARMLILRPVPSLISGDSTEETLEPKVPVTDFGAWFAGLLASTPAAYGKIDAYLKQVMPDLKDIKNPVVAKDSRSLLVQFSNGPRSVFLPFEDLSDGEKFFMICSLVLAANDAYGPLLCYWDEPDNHLALSEVGHFVMALRKAFQSGGQCIVTSHNPEAIRVFSDENTLVLERRNHLEPTTVRPLSEMQINGDLIGALIRGDVES